MNSLIKSTLLLTVVLFPAWSAAAELIDLSPDQLKSLQQETQPLVVDIRTDKELDKSGIISDSRSLTFFSEDGNYDIEDWLAKLQQQKQSPDQAVILVCQGGIRSEQVGKFLAGKLDMDNIYHLKGGIHAWKKQGNATEPACSTTATCTQK